LSSLRILGDHVYSTEYKYGAAYDACSSGNELNHWVEHTAYECSDYHGGGMLSNVVGCLAGELCCRSWPASELIS